MPTNRLDQLRAIGQSVWYDNFRRALLDSGELLRLIQTGVTGVTSNPTIFEKAIDGSTDYDADLHRLVDQGKTAPEIYESLALDDIRRTADLLRPIYEQTGGADGYVSLEVSPLLAPDTEGTVAEARRLFAALDRPNTMIKVPATPAGIPAVAILIGEGININITLMFSLAQYLAVVEAYLSGLEKLAAATSDLSRVASVASFFVSRVDTAVDRALEHLEPQHADVATLLGKIAIANAKVVYARFRSIFSGPRWQRLADRGARLQRVLWASTGTKNPLYPDTLYVDSLIGPDTINTMPPATLQAFLDHGQVTLSVEAGLDEARANLERLAGLGVDLDAITRQLTDEGVAAFSKSFETLMASISRKCERLRAGWQHCTANLGTYQARVDRALADMADQRVIARIWAHDHTVWKPAPAEISNRLGWLHSAEVMQDGLHRLDTLVEGVQAAGYTHALLLGMGGSSLAPEALRKTFGVKHDGRSYLDLAVLDSTDPGAVLAQARRLDLAHTLFVVSTKSGTTVEPLSFFKFFYNRVLRELGESRAGEHFVAITDPGTPLVELADRYRFRATYLNDPHIGGRYSAFSYFGLVPAALIGVEVPHLLDRALTMATACEVAGGDNPAAWLGAALGELALAGRDKVTLVSPPLLVSFGDWVEQLIAESTGKEGKGILPVVGEPPGTPDVYGNDRLFVQLGLNGSAAVEGSPAGGDGEVSKVLDTLEGAGHPVVRLHLHDAYDLGGQFFLWEMATAIAGARLGINPFDQPNVESAKRRARDMVAAFQKSGRLPKDPPAHLGPASLHKFLSGASAGDYISIQAYLTPTPETDALLRVLRTGLRDRYRLATTVGYGPRFLHSTGQLHKGDAGHGLFIQLTADGARDLPIPDEAGSPTSSITFGVLEMAQALGDKQALLDAGRRAIRFHLGTDVPGGLRQLAEGLPWN
jgi:transaldolase/glucose-6-phosphate isomerase